VTFAVAADRFAAALTSDSCRAMAALRTRCLAMTFDIGRHGDRRQQRGDDHDDQQLQGGEARAAARRLLTILPPAT